MSDQGFQSDVGAIPVSSPPDPDAPPVARSLEGPLAILTMQSPPHNFLGTALFYGLIEAMRWAIERQARAVLLRSGLRHFCAGADLTLFAGAVEGQAPDLDVTELLTTFDELPMPIVAAVNGVRVGGGRTIGGRSVAEQVIAEVEAVARAEGHPLSSQSAADLTATLTDPTSSFGPSMFRD